MLQVNLGTIALYINVYNVYIYFKIFYLKFKCNFKIISVLGLSWTEHLIPTNNQVSKTGI